MGRAEKVEVQDTGRLAYRNPETDRYADGRPTLIYPHPFWKSEAERLRYERAAEGLPRKEYLKLGLYEYFRAIVEVAEGLKPKDAGRAMSWPAESGR